MPLPRKMPGSQKKIDNFFVPVQKRLCLGIEGSQAGNDSHESQPADRAIGATSINENPAEVVLDGEPSFTTDLDRTTSNSGACAPVETARREDSPQDVPSLPPKGYKFPSNQTGRSSDALKSNTVRAKGASSAPSLAAAEKDSIHRQASGACSA
ncbi:uncharacterized protein LOC144096799 [Amblyomma americanum]